MTNFSKSWIYFLKKPVASRNVQTFVIVVECGCLSIAFTLPRSDLISLASTLWLRTLISCFANSYFSSLSFKLASFNLIKTYSICWTCFSYGISAAKRDQIVKKFFFKIMNILDQMIKFTSISLMKKFFIKFSIWSLFAAFTPYICEKTNMSLR